VRPTDENQHGSTRPNLMSSGTRRGGSEDNILAMLERNAERGRLSAAPRIALYAGAGVLILGLLSTLAWLLHENQSTNDALRAVEQAAVVPIPDRPAVTALATATARIEPPGSPATIVDDPQPAAAKASATVTAQVVPAPLPPLVLLSSEEATSKRGARPERASAARPQPVREAAQAPELPQAHPAAPTPVAKAPARPRPAAATTAPPKAVARVAPVKAKKQQAAPAVSTSETSADNDVALISAIISHSSRHAQERAPGDAGTACGAGGDKKCAARQP
jgi:hypothetical protein